MVTGSGGLSEPQAARRSRASTRFAGEIFHSARWNHDYDLTGKRVAVIGTGASAIQIVPEIAEAGRPPRRLPAHRPVGDAAQRPRLHRDRAVRLPATCPFVQKAYRTGIYWGRECFVPGVHRRTRKLAAPAEKLAARSNIERGITDPAAARRR